MSRPLNKYCRWLREQSCFIRNVSRYEMRLAVSSNSADIVIRWPIRALYVGTFIRNNNCYLKLHSFQNTLRHIALGVSLTVWAHTSDQRTAAGYIVAVINAYCSGRMQWSNVSIMTNEQLMQEHASASEPLEAALKWKSSPCIDGPCKEKRWMWGSYPDQPCTYIQCSIPQTGRL